MLPLEAAAWSTAPLQRNGTPNEPLVGQNRESLRRMRPCEPMWRSDWLASSPLRVARLWPGRPCPGKAVDMGGGKIGGGQTLGADFVVKIADESGPDRMSGISRPAAG